MMVVGQGSTLSLYAKALIKALPLPGRRLGGGLPVRAIDRSVPLDAVAYAGFTSVVEAKLDDTVHPGYLHVLAFPLSLQLLSDPEVPLPMMGMVHIGNRVDMHAPVRLGEVIDLHVELAGPYAHPSGTTIDVMVEGRVDGRLRMVERTTYLAKGARLSGAIPREEAERVPFAAPAATALWRIAPITAKRYAKASGDYNPIHVNGLAAKGFGFPTVIAHGMYCASRAFAAVDARLDSYRWDVTFAKPVVLPATVGFAIVHGRRHETSRAVVFDPKRGKPHVFSQVTGIE